MPNESRSTGNYMMDYLNECLRKDELRKKKEQKENDSIRNEVFRKIIN